MSMIGKVCTYVSHNGIFHIKKMTVIDAHDANFVVGRDENDRLVVLKDRFDATRGRVISAKDAFRLVEMHMAWAKDHSEPIPQL